MSGASTAPAAPAVPAAPAAPDAEVLTVLGPGTEYHLQGHWLLPRAMDPAAMRAAARALLVARGDEGTAEPLRRASTAAFMHLCAADDEAQVAETAATLRELAAAQARGGDPRGHVSTVLRLVQALQLLGRADEAAALACTTLEEQSADDPRRHFVLHHLGKALLQQGRHAEARAALREALALREQLRDEVLVRSTQAAIDRLPHPASPLR